MNIEKERNFGAVRRRRGLVEEGGEGKEEKKGPKGPPETAQKKNFYEKCQKKS